MLYFIIGDKEGTEDISELCINIYSKIETNQDLKSTYDVVLNVSVMTIIKRNSKFKDVETVLLKTGLSTPSVDPNLP